MSKLSFVMTLVRHGQTEANKARIIQGQSNYALSEIGRLQAEKLGLHFKKTGVNFDLVFSSDLDRALETAQIVLGPSYPIAVDARLRERAFGEIEGQSSELFREAARKSGLSDQNLSSYTPKGAETLNQVTQRVADFCNSHLASVVKPNYNVLVVTHGGVIREFMRFFRDVLRCDLRQLEPMKVTPNTGVNQFKIESSPSKLLRAVCLKIHDVNHLEDNSNLMETKIAHGEETVEAL